MKVSAMQLTSIILAELRATSTSTNPIRILPFGTSYSWRPPKISCTRPCEWSLTLVRWIFSAKRERNTMESSACGDLYDTFTISLSYLLDWLCCVGSTFDDAYLEDMQHLLPLLHVCHLQYLLHSHTGAIWSESRTRGINSFVSYLLICRLQ